MRNLFHLHLPKTGGMALHAFMVDQLGKEQVSPPLGGGDLNDELLKWSGITAISGHFVARQGNVLPKDRFCLTALRSPIERLLSEFQYNKHDVDDLLLDARRFVLDLDTYVEQIMQVSSEEALVQLSMLYPLGTECQNRLTLDEKLAAATRVLDQFDLVGVQEELDDVACMLAVSMGWPVLPLNRLNVSSKSIALDALSSRQMHALTTLLEPEIELYNHVLKRFRNDRRRFIGHSGGEGSSKIHDRPGTILDGVAVPALKDFGDMRCEITSVSVAGKINGFQQVMAGELMDITIQFVAHEPVEQLNAGIAIRDEHGLLMFGTNSLLQGESFVVAAGRYAVTFTLLNRLGPGHYVVDASLIRTASHYDDCYHWREQVSQFSVDAYAVQHYEGRVLMDVDVHFGGLSSGAIWTRMQSTEKSANVRAFGRLNEPLKEFLSFIEPMTQVDILPSGVDTLLQVKLRNQSNEAWSSKGRNPVHLSYQWRLEDGSIVVEDGLRTCLRDDVPAGGSLILPLLLRTPRKTGRFVLLISLVQEQVAWFCDRQASSACYLPIEVR
jgi:hypothetical protein